MELLVELVLEQLFAMIDDKLDLVFGFCQLDNSVELRQPLFDKVILVCNGCIVRIDVCLQILISLILQ